MADDRVEKRINRQRGAWRDNAREVKGADFSFNIAAGTPSTVGRRSNTPIVTSVQRAQSRSVSRGPTPQNGTSSTSRRIRNQAISVTRRSEASASKASITPNQPQNKRKRMQTEQSDDIVDELSMVGAPNTKGRKSISGMRISISPDEVLDEDELNQDSSEHLIQALPSSEGRRRTTEQSFITPGQIPSASESSQRLSTSTSKVRVPLADIDENSVAFLPALAEVLNDHEIVSNEPGNTSDGKRKSGLKSRQSSIRSRDSEATVTKVQHGQVQAPLEADWEEDELASVIVEPRKVSSDRKRISQAPPRGTDRPKKPRKQGARQIKPRRNGPREVIPICIYRPTRGPRADTDPFGDVSLPYVSPVDTIRQLMEEFCRNYVQRHSDGASARTIVAWKDFRNALQDSLFDVQIAQNSVNALASRLRQVKRSHGDQAAELMQLKRRRQEVALEIDSVRQRHRQRAKEEEEKNLVRSNLQNLKQAAKAYYARADVQEDADRDPTVLPIQDLLQDVKAMVGNGGILQVVKHWNSSLETVLEKL